MSNPFDTDPEIIVDQLRQLQLRREQQMATYAEFEAAGWQVSECGAFTRSDDVVAAASPDDTGFRITFLDIDIEFSNVSAKDAVAYVKAVEHGLRSK